MAFRNTAYCVLIAVSYAAFAQAPQRNPMLLDVAGVRLDMTPAQAKTALIAAGYRITAENKGESFDQVVRRTADSRLGRPIVFPTGISVNSIDATGPRMEKVAVGFAQRPGGSTVAGVSLTIPKVSMTAAAFVALAISKYGSPGLARFNQAAMYWCSKEVGSNCGRDAVVTGEHWSRYPSLRTEAYSDPRIWLDIGTMARRDLDRSREAAVEALVPKTKQAAF